MRRKKKRSVQKVLIVILGLTLILAIGVVIFLYGNRQLVLSQQVSAEKTEEAPIVLIEESITEEQIKENEEIPEDKLQEASVPIYHSPIDFHHWQEINQDVYAWIKIPGTQIDYPILQHETDHTYYLHYNIDGSEGYPGCIYTENLNSKDFEDNNTIIYGHNMKDGTMFADLHRYKDEQFLREHETLMIYLPDGEYQYTIFAAYIYDDRHLLYSFDFADTDVFASYIDSVLQESDGVVRKDISIGKEDEIITLATCIGSQPDKRFLVQAVRVN